MITILIIIIGVIIATCLCIYGGIRFLAYVIAMEICADIESLFVKKEREEK